MGYKGVFFVAAPPLCKNLLTHLRPKQQKKNCILNEQLYLRPEQTARPLANLINIIISYTQFLIHGDDNVRALFACRVSAEQISK